MNGKDLVKALYDVFDGDEASRQALEYARELVDASDQKTPTWQQWFMGIVHMVARKSKDTTRVGAMAVDPSTRAVLSMGFNGIPMGVKDLPERYERPEKYLWVSHAEENLVALAARKELAGAIVYVTHPPCSRCSRLLVQAGVAKVIVGQGTTSMPAREFEVGRTIFHEAGVCCIDAEGQEG